MTLIRKPNEKSAQLFHDQVASELLKLLVTSWAEKYLLPVNFEDETELMQKEASSLHKSQLI